VEYEGEYFGKDEKIQQGGTNDNRYQSTLPSRILVGGGGGIARKRAWRKISKGKRGQRINQD